ncbi:MAG: tRNA (adenosine(37)-N6)-threonylcarbamoyltransferase complex transferase subunit TsaD [Planctomycetes bacterium]|nr:tRNA (adenosine(37)-N6)-threonylcarbamoyltransferase complex transferase subunit TsaD [Planctomycetota bacterium]
MTKQTLILGLESSCDETAAAIVAAGKTVISSVIASQDKLHEKYGGVVPEIAARAHIENILPVLKETLDRAQVTAKQIDAIAVANCPGLAPALLIAVTAAKTLALAWSKPLIAINHIHSHLQSVMLENDDEQDFFPAIALVVSGGHTSIYQCGSPIDLNLIGYTIDDAAGEAFDKVATILNLPYPGGPHLEKLALQGNPQAIDFPRTYLKKKDSLNFSFSGIKTAVLYHCRGQNMLGENRVEQMSEAEKADIAASFQAAMIEVLVNKTLRAAQQVNAKIILLGGGVAANQTLRNHLENKCLEAGRRLIVAPKKYCTDNAAMVAGLAYYKYKAGLFSDLSLEAKPISPDIAAVKDKKRVGKS